jgi:hypothetical protein
MHPIVLGNHNTPAHILCEQILARHRHTSFGGSYTADVMIKLYRRDEIGGLRYHEAWTDDDSIVEHWGVVGDTGESAHRLRLPGESEEAGVERMLAPARAAGFAEIGDMTLIEVQYDLDGWGSSEDLELRHTLENHLDEVLGWAGLGHVDGGSIGSGKMEVACVVVDVEIAKRVIAGALEEVSAPQFSRINVQQD